MKKIRNCRMEKSPFLRSISASSSNICVSSEGMSAFSFEIDSIFSCLFSIILFLNVFSVFILSFFFLLFLFRADFFSFLINGEDFTGDDKGEFVLIREEEEEEEEFNKLEEFEFKIEDEEFNKLEEEFNKLEEEEFFSGDFWGGGRERSCWGGWRREIN